MVATGQAQQDEQESFNRRSRDEGDRGGSTPNPDPTVLTTDALLREIAALRTLIDQRISATEQLFETKIMLGREGGMALKELMESEFETSKLDRANIHLKISERAEAAAELLAEKFRIVETRFDLMEAQRRELKNDSEEQRKELKSDSAVSLAAALAAQKEQAEKQTTTFTASIEKSETSQVRQFDQISSNFKTEIAGIVGTLGDIKDRLTTIESIKRGGDESNVATRSGRDDNRANVGMYVALAGMFFTMLIVAIGALTLLSR